MSYLTFHILRALPMHNLNRDQNGMPKSQFDGGIQRARLSSQALKRPARIAFREALGVPTSIRTMDESAVTIVVGRAKEFAAAQEKSFDQVAAKKSAAKVIKSLAKKGKEEAKEASDGDASVDKKHNILLFSDAEFDTLAQAIVEEQNGGAEATVNDFIQDFRSPSLDVAAFGRMFANRADKSTQAAVAVSHAVTTHEMSLTIDYFTAVDEHQNEVPAVDSGAAHLGLAYYTSGVYYSTFTIDPDQLVRSWSGITAPSARDQVSALIHSLITALPTGKLTNTNAHTLPFLVLVEDQRSRTVYEFETPVTRERNAEGGYTMPSIRALAEQYALARSFDAANFRDTFLYVGPGSEATFDGATITPTVGDLVDNATDLVLAAVTKAGAYA